VNAQALTALIRTAAPSARVVMCAAPSPTAGPAHRAREIDM
jgi:hypothetical protein